jgi:hypothetical protein
MANTRILAMSNVIDSFTSSSHAKQGFYGKQLKVIGTCPSSPSTMGAELDLIIKVLRNDGCPVRNRTNTLPHSSQFASSFWLFFGGGLHRFTSLITLGQRVHCFHHPPSFTAGKQRTWMAPITRTAKMYKMTLLHLKVKGLHDGSCFSFHPGFRGSRLTKFSLINGQLT